MPTTYQHKANELLKQRASLYEQMKAIIDGADAEGRGLTAEEKAVVMPAVTDFLGDALPFGGGHGRRVDHTERIAKVAARIGEHPQHGDVDGHALTLRRSGTLRRPSGTMVR